MSPDNYGAAALAWQLEQLCAWGITLRDRGRCSGGARTRDMLQRSDRFECWAVLQGLEPKNWKPGRARALRARAETHARGGHDLGCATIGVPFSLLTQLAQRWDGQGAARYLTEAIREAATEIAADLRRSTHPAELWRAERAWESVVFTVHQRITPTVTAQEFPTHEWGRGS
ncbi:hypothetical protein G7067_09400 [Leucobacter insecticola]|uniref:Uncharacterized protein n=1 Tax=Leucobacter insecticola TaxID=2714934 RepID=A0A6G8FJE3_9MICO|nr:hypothetical protein [Leucobacter insecticola]QIM16576.1 hypothetical protein G7067_09400 [Leucobacter insecticola]